MRRFKEIEKVVSTAYYEPGMPRRVTVDLGFWLWLTLAAGLALLSSVATFAQVMGPVAEMDRLERRADEAIANGDAEGAAMTAGKAALMAAQLARGASPASRSQLYHAAESVYRGQEHAYRAVALFERTGSQVPAPAGVCELLSQSGRAIADGVKTLALDPPSDLPTGDTARWQRLRTAAQEWPPRLEGLGQDWRCPARQAP